MRDRLAFTIAEAAEAAATGRTALYEAIASGDLPARKRGRRTLVLAVDLHTWLVQLPALKLKRAPIPSDASSQGCAEQAEPNDKRPVEGATSAERERRDAEATRLELDTKARRSGPGKSRNKGRPTPMRGA